MSKITNYLSLSLKVAIPVVAVMLGADAFAAEVATVGDQLGNVQKEVGVFGSLAKAAFTLVGAILLFIGINGFYKYSKDERSFPLWQAGAATICGGLLLGFSTVADMVTGSTTGGTVEESDVFEVK